MRDRAILLLAAFLPALAMSAPIADRAEVRVRAHVMAKVHMRHAEAVRTVQLPPGAGVEVEVANAATFEVFANTGGFAFEFQLADPAVEEVTVLGMDAPVKVGAHGGRAPVRMAPQARIERRTLHYRVRYAAGTPPGPRPAPLAVSVQANL